jgi:hypothetical protein
MKNKEYRMMDHNVFDKNLINQINIMAQSGWVIIRILEPIKYPNLDAMFIRIFYER